MKIPVSRLIRHMSKKAGQPPGLLEHVSVAEAEDTSVSFISFDEHHFSQISVSSAEEIKSSIKHEATNWAHFSGFRDLKFLEQIGLAFDVHQLLVEDVVNVEHIAKMEVYDHHLFFTLNILHPAETNGTVIKNHISFVLGHNYLLSFSENKTDIFDPFIARIGQAIGKIRQRKCDYLFYRLVDIIVDHYFVMFGHLEQGLEEIEDELISNPVVDMVHEIQAKKKELFYLKKNIFPVSDAIRSLLKDENKFVKKNTLKFLSDTNDHLIQLVQLIEGFRETITGLMEIQMANVSNRMNSVMKTLTMIATIFIPLTFLAGIYGMNFENMPELKIAWAYPLLLFVMLVSGIGMYIFMKRRKWF